jgi:hypothetical protein
MKFRNTLAYLLLLAFLLSCKKEHTTTIPIENSLDSGLIAYYPFNGDGTDKSGNGYNLTIAGPTITIDRFGNSSSAYKFNGLSDYMVIPGLIKADSLRQFTISMWAKPTDIIYNTMISILPIISYNCSSSILLSYEGSRFILRDRVLFKDTPSECTVSLSADSLINPSGSWHHFVLVQTYINGTNEPYPRYNYDQYYDGKKFSLGSSGIGSNPLAVSFLKGGIIGGNNTNGNYTTNFEMFNGDIDEVRIYNRALSLTEISELFILKN